MIDYADFNLFGSGSSGLGYSGMKFTFRLAVLALHCRYGH
jgi:hypothetical protein